MYSISADRERGERYTGNFFHETFLVIHSMDNDSSLNSFHPMIIKPKRLHRPAYILLSFIDIRTQNEQKERCSETQNECIFYTSWMTYKVTISIIPWASGETKEYRTASDKTAISRSVCSNAMATDLDQVRICFWSQLQTLPILHVSASRLCQLFKQCNESIKKLI